MQLSWTVFLLLTETIQVVNNNDRFELVSNKVEKHL